MNSHNICPAYFTARPPEMESSSRNEFLRARRTISFPGGFATTVRRGAPHRLRFAESECYHVSPPSASAPCPAPAPSRAGRVHLRLCKSRRRFNGPRRQLFILLLEHGEFLRRSARR